MEILLLMSRSKGFNYVLAPMCEHFAILYSPLRGAYFMLFSKNGKYAMRQG